MIKKNCHITLEGTKKFPTITVVDLLSGDGEFLGLTPVYGKKGLNRIIKSSAVQKTGLPLTGDIKSLYRDRLQIMGKSELRFLNQLASEERRKNLEAICKSDIPCIVVTRDLKIPAELAELAEEYSLPVLSCLEKSAFLSEKIVHFLEDKLSPCISVHGTLVEIHGIGVILMGSSGIGKSECALNLITKGHRLVTDDRVLLRKKSGNIIVGSSPDCTKHYMELRGIGFINIKDMFGATAILDKKQLDLVISLEKWDGSTQYDRSGLEEETLEVFNQEIPHLIMPVASGRNTAVLVEVAARNHILKLRGFNAAEMLDRRHREATLKNGEDEKE